MPVAEARRRARPPRRPSGRSPLEQLAQEVLARRAQLAGRAVEHRERGALRALDARRPRARRARVGDRARAEAAPAERRRRRRRAAPRRRPRPAPRRPAARAALPFDDGEPRAPPPRAARADERRARGEQREQRGDEERAAEGLRRAAVELLVELRRAGASTAGRSAADDLRAARTPRRGRAAPASPACSTSASSSRARSIFAGSEQRRVEHARRGRRARPAGARRPGRR